MPKHIKRLVEPFSGMAAISVAVASENRAERYYLNDINEPLIKILKEAIETPEKLLEEYTKVWNEQFSPGIDNINHFYVVRERFNAGEKSPANLLYLIARCVKGAVRYGNEGNFNQSPDKRRHGTNPRNLRKNIFKISSLLKNKTEFSALDYKKVFEITHPGDLIYMDPPYQGVTNVRDNRYFSGIDFEDFSESLEILNKKGIDYIISYDGECGNKEYGKSLPDSLGCKKIMLNAGLSSQALLLGKKSITYEALYISKGLVPHFSHLLEQPTLYKGAIA